MKSTGTKMASAALLLIATLSWAFAHEGATGVVLERMEQMKVMSKSIKLMGRILQTERPDADIIATEAKRIAESAEHVPHLFPDGSFNHPSEASLKILEDRDRFEELNTAMKAEAAKLAELAATDASLDAVGAGILRLGDSCKACHKVFREKKN